MVSALNGWIPAGESWSYSSWDDTNGVSTAVITVPSDARNKYQEGMRVKFTQSTGGTKYGIITKVAETALAVFLNTDYAFNNESITSPYYSPMKVPLGFDLDPDKWTVETLDTSDKTKTSATAGTWYNPGSLFIDLPIGEWRVRYSVAFRAYHGGADYVDGETTLSTTNNSESQEEFTAHKALNAGQDDGGALAFIRTMSREKHVGVTTKVTYYLNGRLVNNAGDLQFKRTLHKTVIMAVCTRYCQMLWIDTSLTANTDGGCMN